MSYFEQRRELLVKQPVEQMLQYLEDSTGKWHDGAGENVPLREYLGLTKEEYQTWVITPSLLKLK